MEPLLKNLGHYVSMLNAQIPLLHHNNKYEKAEGILSMTVDSYEV